jgi:hypothetical protein
LKDRGRNTRRPSTPRGPHLHVFASDYEWVVASSAKDAASFMLGECGRFVWIFRNRRVLRKPIAAKGRQGLWTPSPELVAQVAEELARA